MMGLLLLCSCSGVHNNDTSKQSSTETPTTAVIIDPTPTADVSTEDTTQADTSEQSIGWIDAEVARFYVPEGFVESNYEGFAKAPGVRPYSYKHPDLDMSIDVACLTAPEINMGASWLEDSYDYYLQTDGITYNTSAENSFTVSGYSGSDVFYISAIKIGDQGIGVSVYYPAANKDKCDRILEDFMKSLSY